MTTFDCTAIFKPLILWWASPQAAVSPLGLELIKGIFTLAALGLAAMIGSRTYFRQKDYELAKQRYLEQGLDVVAGDLPPIPVPI